ncbi:hypothetical protein [Solimonas marina]|uniref:Uncharacterized protein n=1 Tax=Solimonas marina TaxID=2714601 RepID=A0A969W9C1_9GAMM|nr:hypothetical protein [Solimonas marina]NKF21934.1 hypothetical protein [Solimonas marina]
MKIWQVQLWGAGFVREGVDASFELSGIVSAATVDEAVTAAVALASNEHPEIDQAQPGGSGPRAVINAEEIQEFASAPASSINVVEVFWSTNGEAA